jgi:hypothetical protein
MVKEDQTIPLDVTPQRFRVMAKTTGSEHSSSAPAVFRENGPATKMWPVHLYILGSSSFLRWIKNGRERKGRAS